MHPSPQRVKFERHWLVEQAEFTQAKLPAQFSVSVHADPSAEQVWTAALFGLQRRALGLQMPVQAPSRQTFGQAAAASFHKPLASQT